MKIETLAKMIPQEAEPLVIELVDRIGKMRALADDESLLVETVVKKQSRRNAARTYRNWKPNEDRELLARQFRHGAVAEYAREIGVSIIAAHSRLSNLRKGKTKRNRVEG